MAWHLTFRGDEVLVQRRAEAPDDGDGAPAVGDLRETVRPGEEFLGHTYEELRDMGEGEREL